MKADKAEKKQLTVKVRQTKPIEEQIEYKLVSSRNINLTEEAAYRFLEMKTFQGERQVNDRHVQHLFDEYCQGRFMWEQCTIGICKMGTEVYRINGQHTCWMRANIKGNDIECSVRELVYEVPDEHNLRLLYSTFDQAKSRTNAHNFKVLMTGHNCSAEIWPSSINKLAAGVRLWLYPRSEDRNRSSASDLEAVISTQHPKLFALVGVYWQNRYANYKVLQRAAVIAAMFATFNANQAKAHEFWEPICTGLGLNSKNDPRYRIRLFLDTHSHQHGSGIGGVSVSIEDLYRILINTWNRWRKGEPVSTLRTTDKRVKAI